MQKLLIAKSKCKILLFRFFNKKKPVFEQYSRNYFYDVFEKLSIIMVQMKDYNLVSD